MRLAPIEPLGRGVEAVKLALASFVGANLTVERAAPPLAVTLETLGLQLISGERLTPAEARQMVALVRTTLDVFAAVVADTRQAHGAVVLREAIVLLTALRTELRHMRAQHQQFTAAVAPMLEQLVPHGEHLVPPQASTTLTPASTPPAPLAKIVAALTQAMKEVEQVVPGATDRQAPAAATLAEVISQLEVLVPPEARPAPLAHALAELEQHAPTDAPPAAAHAEQPPGAPAARAEQPPGAMAHKAEPPVAPASTPPVQTPTAKLATCLTEVLAHLDELPPVAVTAEHATSPAAGLANPGPAPLQEIKAQLQVLLAAASQEGTPADADLEPLTRVSLLAELETGSASSSTVFPAALAVHGAQGELFDPYRWGLVAALNYRAVPRRSDRCGICGRTLVRTPDGAAYCPDC
jgi:hypothetical protein